MSCPDEDTFARFVEGRLPPADAAVLERHLDGCARCADLTAMFGRVYAPAEPAPARGWVAGGLCALALLQVAWLLAARALAPALLAAWWPLYAALWGTAGAVAGAFAALAVARGWRLGRPVALFACLLALPTVALTPLALFVVWALRDLRPRGTS